jgi:hypothetical protein
MDAPVESSPVTAQESTGTPSPAWWHHPQARMILGALVLTIFVGLLVWSTGVRADREAIKMQLRTVDALAGAAVPVLLDSDPARARRWCDAVAKEGRFEEVRLSRVDGTEIARAGSAQVSTTPEPKATADAQMRFDGQRRVMLRLVLIGGDNPVGVLRIVDRS